jgi:hypothetical protein
MKATYYLASYAEGKFLVTCSHAHLAVHSAVACISTAGGYVVAVEDGLLRALTDAEEVEFQKAVRGQRTEFNAHSDCRYLIRAKRSFRPI